MDTRHVLFSAVCVVGLLLVAWQSAPNINAILYSGSPPAELLEDGDIVESEIMEEKFSNPVLSAGHISDTKYIRGWDSDAVALQYKFSMTTRYGGGDNITRYTNNNGTKSQLERIGNITYWRVVNTSGVVTETAYRDMSGCKTENCKQSYIKAATVSLVEHTDFAAVNEINSSHDHGTLTRLKLVDVDLDAQTLGITYLEFTNVRILSATGYVDVDENGNVWRANLKFRILMPGKGGVELGTIGLNRTHTPSTNVTRSDWTSQTKTVAVDAVDGNTIRITNTGDSNLTDTSVRVDGGFPNNSVSSSLKIGRIPPGESVYVSIVNETEFSLTEGNYTDGNPKQEPLDTLWGDIIVRGRTSSKAVSFTKSFHNLRGTDGDPSLSVHNESLKTRFLRD